MIATRLSALVRRAEKVFVAMAPNMAPSEPVSLANVRNLEQLSESFRRAE